MPARTPPDPLPFDELPLPEPLDEPDDGEAEPMPWELEESTELESSELDEDDLPGTEPLPDDALWAHDEAAGHPELEGDLLEGASALPEVDDEPWPLWEDEARLLPAGLTRLGWCELALLPGLDLQLEASCDTGAAFSALRCPLTRLGDGRVRLTLGLVAVEAAALEQGGDLLLETGLCLAGQELLVRLRLVDEAADPPLLLGRDALAGRFVVDPRLTHLHGRAPR